MMKLLPTVLSAMVTMTMGFPDFVSSFTASSWTRNSVMASDHLIVGTNNGFDVYDVRNPSQTVRVNTVQTSNFVMGMAVGVGSPSSSSADPSTILYLASWSSGVLTYDISTVTSITQGLGISLPGNSMDITLKGMIGYIASDREGVHVVDFSSQPPAVIASYDFNDGRQVRRIEVNGDLMYVSTSVLQDSVTILRMKELNGQIEVVGHFGTTNKAREIVLVEQQIVQQQPSTGGAGGKTGAGPWPKKPTGPHAGTKPASSTTGGSKKFASLAYTTIENGGLQIFDVSSAAQPVSLSTIALGGVATSVAVDSHYAYVGLIGNGLAIVDIRNPEGPTHLTTYDTRGHVYGVTKHGSYLYVADYHGGMTILDVTP
eukprot:TRINITY_DN871_c1_g4_i1.p1 TRINITY_DN871_c1_g4~~TRINITY_DN871_c1_g4_i1.p1  ORF type:complete len:372 (+),score=80.25 TRINITY_DN871_c1_g4_i1:82-1197(+)